LSRDDDDDDADHTTTIIVSLVVGAVVLIALICAFQFIRQVPDFVISTATTAIGL